MTLNEFKHESDEWLTPLGFTILCRSTDWTSITYVNFDQLGPSITCTYNDGTPKCSITQSHGFKFFMSMVSGEMMFRHPRIKDFIDYCCRVGAILEQANT
jgi:hypothetical protein